MLGGVCGRGHGLRDVCEHGHHLRQLLLHLLLLLLHLLLLLLQLQRMHLLHLHLYMMLHLRLLLLLLLLLGKHQYRGRVNLREGLCVLQGHTLCTRAVIGSRWCSERVRLAIPDAVRHSGGHRCNRVPGDHC